MMASTQDKFSVSSSARTISPHEPTQQIPRRLFFNRDLSLIEFHRRVLEEAFDQNNPLLERLRFLSIFSSNIDEFFMTRVSGLMQEQPENAFESSPDGMTPAEQLAEIRERLLPMIAAQMECWRFDVLPKLRSAGISVAPYHSLTALERRHVDAYFKEQVYPVLTPLAVDPSHPFPYLTPLSVNLGLTVESREDSVALKLYNGRVEPRFVCIQLPPVVPRLVSTGTVEPQFVLLEDLIAAHTSALFPGMVHGACHAFRVTRDADLQIREDEADDLLFEIEQQLRRRPFGTPVRLEVTPTMPEGLVQYLTRSLGITQDQVYVVDGPLHLQDLMTLTELDRPELKYRSLEPFIPHPFRSRGSIFDAIREQDVLVHHPFDSYRCVTDFVDAADDDPAVIAIKICLYRTGPDSPVPPALIRASENGKQVTALIELRARFDEADNIEWARRLDESGVHVVYGPMGRKTHGKLTLVVRREGASLRRYVHIASGNYNPTTSSTYTDLGLFTSKEEIGADASDFFNYLTGFCAQTEYRELMISPACLREQTMDLIDREISHRKAGRPARIVAKLNRLTDTKVIEKLYEASQAGVPIDLIVRGICILRPGVAGLSETIRVRSIVGRFLEHSRILSLDNGGEPEVYIGSADWMPRNLDHRVEVVTPIEDPELKRFVRDVVLAAYLRDNVKARTLMPNAEYVLQEPASGEEAFDAQRYFSMLRNEEPPDRNSGP